MDQIAWTSEYLLAHGFSPAAVNWISFAIDFVLLLILSWLSDFIARKVLLTLISRAVAKTKATWDDYFYEQRVFRNLAHLVPAGVVFEALPVVFNDVPWAIPYLEKVIYLYIIYILVTLVNRTLRALETWFSKEPKYANTPIRTISQVVRILAWFSAVVVTISLLSGTPAGQILGAFAGTTAILMLVFQDSIKGLLANFQIHMYDLVKVGDWITFSKFGVDGNVVSIDLTTVKVQNFDKTVSTVPSTAFTSDSFVNWRSMSESGARRIKRNIHIDIQSIRHLDDALFAQLEQVDRIAPFMHERQSEIAEYNSSHPAVGTSLLNGRRQTNVGLYRKYIENYLRNHPSIAQDFTLMVRQLQPTTQGLPIEVYCFSNTTDWGLYEGIMADIFDHLYAATRQFDLRLFQEPSGADIRALKKNAETLGS